MMAKITIIFVTLLLPDKLFALPGAFPLSGCRSV